MMTQKQKKVFTNFCVIFARILGGEQSKQRLVDLVFCNAFSAGSSRNPSRAVKSYAAREAGFDFL